MRRNGDDLEYFKDCLRQWLGLSPLPGFIRADLSRAPLGDWNDHEIASEYDVSVSQVRCERARRGIGGSRRYDRSHQRGRESPFMRRPL